jgi:hypothetical protein
MKMSIERVFKIMFFSKNKKTDFRPFLLIL